MNKRTLISIITSSAATVAGVLFRSKISDQLKPGDDLLATIYYFTLVVAVAFAVLAFEQGLSFSFRTSKRLRKIFHYISRNPYIEGYWVDIGISRKGGEGRIYNYSFITIQYNDGKYSVDGTTWNVDDTQQTGWNDTEAEFNKHERRLTLWYTVTTEASQSAFKADFQFKNSGGWRQDEMTGSYLGDFTTSGKRVESARFLRDGRSKNEKTQSEILFGLAEQKEIAHQYLEEVRREAGMGPGEYKFKDQNTRIGSEYADWYATFLKHTNNKTDERKLLREAFQKVPLGKVTSILDIGPGDGLLTEVIVQQIFEKARGRELSYVGVEPNPLFHKNVLSQVAKHFASNKIRLVTQGIDAFLQMEGDSRFDLIMAFHSLYFTDDISSVIQCLAEHRFNEDQTLIAFHTDVAGNQLLNQLVAEGGAKFNSEIVGSLADVASKAGFIAGTPEKRDVLLQFPKLAAADWDKLKAGSGLGSSPNLVATLELVCFLANRDFDSLLAENRWKPVIGLITEFHQRTSPHSSEQQLSIPLPVQFQYFIRRA